MAKHKSSGSSNQGGHSNNNPSHSQNNLTPSFSNASTIHPVNTGSSTISTASTHHHLPQHIYHNPDGRKDHPSNSLTPPTTISGPIPPLPQRQHSNHMYRDALANSHRERERDNRDFRTQPSPQSFAPPISTGYHPRDQEYQSMESSLSASSPISPSITSYNPYLSSSSNPTIQPHSSSQPHSHSSYHQQQHQQMPSPNSPYSSTNNPQLPISTGTNLSSSQPLSTILSAVQNHAQSPSRSSSSSSSHSSTQLSPVSSIRSSMHTIADPQSPSSNSTRNILPRPPSNISAPSPSVRSSIISVFDDNASIMSSKKSEVVNIQRPKDDAEIESMFIDLMVC